MSERYTVRPHQASVTVTVPLVVRWNRMGLGRSFAEIDKYHRSSPASNLTPANQRNLCGAQEFYSKDGEQFRPVR